MVDSSEKPGPLLMVGKLERDSGDQEKDRVGGGMKSKV
jgi:hypothetical protein